MQLIIICVIVLILFYLYYSRAARTNREFLTGFWTASQPDCDRSGYSNAFLYMNAPNADTNISRAYIVALKGGTGSINRPFDFDMKTAFSGGATCGKMFLDGKSYEIAVDLNYLTGTMIWRDSFGNPLFTWSKNNEISNNL